MFVKNLLARCGNDASLPKCYSQLTPANRRLAKDLAKKINDQLKDLPKIFWKQLTPAGVKETLFLNLCAGNHSIVLNLAERIAQEPQPKDYLSSELYILILQLLASQAGSRRSTAFHTKDSFHVALATQLCSELVFTGCSDDDLQLAFNLVLDCAFTCDDFTQLIPLRILFTSVSSKIRKVDLENRYLSTVMNIYINSSQYMEAVEYLHLLQSTYKHSKERLYSTLPLERVIDFMCSTHDCSNLMQLLRDVLLYNSKLVSTHLWIKALNLGLSLNHYDLVKLIYDAVLAKGVNNAISVDDILFDNKIVNLRKENAVFGSLTETTISEVIHTLATHGDVSLCLSLVEFHYLLNSLKGQSSLSKEVCIDIVQSYCFHVETELNNNIRDESVKKVIDVIHNFMSKQKGRFTYVDISDAFLFKLLHYWVYDQNAEDAKLKEQSTIAKLAEHFEGEPDEFLPRKMLSAPTSTSQLGSVLMNMETLEGFVDEHISYILQRKYGLDTLRIFLNLVLNHVTKYQNFSGLITVLESLRIVNETFPEEWLDSDLVKIIGRCLASSHANMASGFQLFCFLKATKNITPETMEYFIFSALRNPEDSTLLQYYLYEYLKSRSGAPSALLVERISHWANENVIGRLLAEVLSDAKISANWENIWNERSYISHFSELNPLNVLSSKHTDIDLRDLRRLQELFPLETCAVKIEAHNERL